MAKIAESIPVKASLAETWDHYFDRRGWSAWVDGFAAVVSASGYPEVGGALRWRSTAAGRGVVEERVLEHEPRRRHKIEFSDPQSEGTLLTTFAIEGEGTRVSQELEYRLRNAGLFGPITDRFFIRSALTRSVQRSLVRFRHEVEEIAELGSGVLDRASDSATGNTSS